MSPFTVLLPLLLPPLYILYTDPSPFLNFIKTPTNIILYVLTPILSHFIPHNLIPKISPYLLKANLSGKDLGKKGTPAFSTPIPEATGLICGTSFIILLSLTASLPHSAPDLLKLTSSLFSIMFMLFLGFTDDVLEWPWRYKLLLPLMASVPLLACYDGSTSVLVPVQARGALEIGAVRGALSALGVGIKGGLLELGGWYSLYMSMLSIFSTNAINIYAGINGLEAGQTVVIAAFVSLHNVIELANNSHDGHLFSLRLSLPLLACSAALLRRNWYPARCFVGDTFCYFAGMTVSVCGIHGHFSKTLLLLMLPQIVNFLYSVPQLFRIVHCPRHRLPRYLGPEKDMMTASEYAPGKANMTLINLALRIFGDMHEESLCQLLLWLQVLSGALGLAVRYGGGSKVFFEEEL